jgi:hypothetical protein
VNNDTEEILELFHDIIEGLGHEMVGRTYAPYDLQQVMDAHPDMAIVDLVMGGPGDRRLAAATEAAHEARGRFAADHRLHRRQDGGAGAAGLARGEGRRRLQALRGEDLERAINRALRVTDLRSRDPV